MTDQTTDTGNEIKAMYWSLLERYAIAVTSRHRWIIYASGPVDDNEICMTVYDPATEQAKHLTITITDRDQPTKINKYDADAELPTGLSEHRP